MHCHPLPVTPWLPQGSRSCRVKRRLWRRGRAGVEPPRPATSRCVGKGLRLSAPGRAGGAGGRAGRGRRAGRAAAPLPPPARPSAAPFCRRLPRGPEAAAGTAARAVRSAGRELSELQAGESGAAAPHAPRRAGGRTCRLPQLPAAPTRPARAAPARCHPPAARPAPPRRLARPGGPGCRVRPCVPGAHCCPTGCPRDGRRGRGRCGARCESLPRWCAPHPCARGFRVSPRGGGWLCAFQAGFLPSLRRRHRVILDVAAPTLRPFPLACPRGSRVALLPPLLTEKLTLECDNSKVKNCLHHLAGDVPLAG